MTDDDRLRSSLLALRLTVFLVMLIWTLDKFLNPAHASGVYEAFYFLKGFGPAIVYAIGAIELIIILGFVAGAYKTLTYGLVLLFHAVSTLSSFRQYLDPYDGANILFFAAWPMLAACIALYLLRERDTLLTV